MVLLFPLVVIAAVVFVARRRDLPEFERRGRGPLWLGAWALAGAAMTLSFLAGFSFGLLVLPFAAALLLAVARRSPHPREALGFPAGIAAMVLLVVFAV